MAVKIKLARFGKIREPFYRVVVADARTRRSGRAIESIGKYHPKAEPSVIEIDSERAQYWLGVGAQPTESVSRPAEGHRRLAEVQGRAGRRGHPEAAAGEGRQADAATRPRWPPSAATDTPTGHHAAQEGHQEGRRRCGGRRGARRRRGRRRRTPAVEHRSRREHRARPTPLSTWSGASSSTTTTCSVDLTTGRRGRTLQVRVHPDDLGKVIGRGGRTATALRTVMTAVGGRGIRVDVVDTDR